MTQYVCGFLFDESKTLVTLIRKNRPWYLKDKWNGIGGHIEPNEKPLDAMIREFEEETGFHFEDWKLFATLQDIEKQEYHVLMFKGFTNELNVTTKTDESVEVFSLSHLPNLNLVHNVDWLIRIALTDNIPETFEIY